MMDVDSELLAAAEEIDGGGEWVVQVFADKFYGQDTGQKGLIEDRSIIMNLQMF